MNSTLIAIAVVAATGAGALGYLVRYYLFRRPRRTAEFDGGVVSQSWLIEHRAGKQDDRFS
jgi:hypothetical protein